MEKYIGGVGVTDVKSTDTAVSGINEDSGKREVRCNKCGKVMDFFDLQANFTIHTNVGYGSMYDGTEIEMHLCCDCFDKLVESCEVAPVIRDWWSDERPN